MHELNSDVLDQLPDEIRDMIDAEEVSKQEQLNALGLTIAAKRTEAINGRLASGIEQTWTECEESYLGIDDMNRGEFTGARWSKPTNMEGPVTTSRAFRDNDVRSTVYPRLVARYVDAGAAKLGEILLPVDDKAFSFEPTPIAEPISGLVPEMQSVPNGPVPNGPLLEDGSGVAMPGVAAPTGAAMPPTMAASDPQAALQDRAKDGVKKAEKRVHDWMVESNYAGETRKIIYDAARIGVGMMKGPYPDISTSKALNGNALKIVQKVVPSLRWIDPWNSFPDPSCGENIQHGDYFLERDFISARTLKGLKRQPGYLKAQIDKVLKEGPGKVLMEGRNPSERESKHRYEIWYFYGLIAKSDLAVAEAVGLDNTDQNEDMHAIITVVNDTVIKAVLNPLESGDFPYHSVPWKRRPGHWAGIGVAEQLRVPDRMLKSATRALLNNAGKSSGSQIVMDQSAVIPADGNYTITPDKIWFKSPDSTMADVRGVFAAFEIPNVTPQLMAIVEYAMRLAEESTSIPLVTQGMTGPTTPETLGATQLQNSNAMALLRSIGYDFDDYLTEPVVQQLYEWLLLDPDVPEEEKVDCKINAHGSAALVERAIQDQTMFQMGQMVLNPAFGADPKKWFAEFLRTRRLDPRDIQFSEEDMAKMQSQPQQPPQLAIAQIRAQSAEKVATIRAQVDMQRAKMDTDRDAVYIQSNMRRDQINAQARVEELRLKRELAYLDLQVKKGIEVDANKIKMADTAMKLRTQKELAFMNARSAQVATPPNEPPGRADNGKAYYQ